MVPIEENEFLLGYTPCGSFEIVLRPVRLPMSGLRRRSPPPPPPRTPSPLPSPPRMAIVRPASGTLGPAVMQQQQQQQQQQQREESRRTPPFRPPPPRTAATAGRAPPPRPPPPRWTDAPSGPWNSPPSSFPWGLQVEEAPYPMDDLPPPYGEVRVTAGGDVLPRVRPSSPPQSDEGFHEEVRGVVRLHSDSPFVRNTRVKVENSVDNDSEVGGMAEAISCLLDFSKRRGLATTPPPPPPPRTPPMPSPRQLLAFGPSEHREKLVKIFMDNQAERSRWDLVKTFTTSTPKRTPSPHPRPGSPPRISSRRVLPMTTPRPTPIRRVPSAALGAPPQMEEDESLDLPDIPENPLTTRSVSMISSLSTYSSEDWETMDEDDDDDDDEFYLEYEYGDPNEDQDPWSSTPPPSCSSPTHEVCVPPGWGERIPGPTVKSRCILCHLDDRHHAIRCTQCKNAPGCCACIWGYMRSRYNSGCPLCRAGDPKDQNPLQQRRRSCRSRVVPGGMVTGIGRARGRGRPQVGLQEEEEEEAPAPGVNSRRGRGRGRRGRRVE